MNDKTEAEGSIDWNRIKNDILLNKRIWKYWALYMFVYYSSYKILSPWYLTKHGVTPIAQTKLDTDQMMLESIVGLDAHKPASLCSTCVNGIAHILLASKKRNIPLKTIINECKNNDYKNDPTDDNICDVHISIWSFLLFIDTIYFYKRRKNNIPLNSNDKLMYFHHIYGLITSLIVKYQNRNGSYISFMGFWSEGIGILTVFGGLLRIYYQKKRPDLISVRYMSDILFFMGIVAFSYARTYLFTKYSIPFTIAYCKNKKNHIITRLCIGLFPGILFLGYYWVFHGIRVIIEKVIEVKE